MKISVQELLIVLAIVVLLVGPTQIPKLSRMFGKTIKNFRDGMSGDEEADNSGNAEKTEQ